MEEQRRGILVARERVSIALDRRRIEKLGFGFDARNYLAQLSLPRDDGPVVADRRRFSEHVDGRRSLVHERGRSQSGDAHPPSRGA